MAKQRPGLIHTTKSIPLSGGIQTDVPDELLDPPGMADIRNARFHKRDQAEKTLPMSGVPLADPDTGANNIASNPPVCWADENEIVTIGRGSVKSLDYDNAAAWASTPVKSELSPMEILGTSAPLAGGTHYTWCFLGDYTAIAPPNPDIFERTGFVIAAQRRSHNDGGTDAVGHIVVASYNMAGKQLSEVDLGTGSMPQLQATGDGATLWYAEGVFSQLRSHRISNAGVIDTATQDSVASALYEANQYFTRANWTWNAATTHDDLRIGYTYNAREYNHAFKYRQRLGAVGAIAEKRNLVNSTINVTKCDLTTGKTSGTAHLVATDVPGTIFFKLLDVETDVLGAFAYVLYSRTDPTAADVNCTVYIAKVTMSTGAINLWTEPASLFGGIVMNGSLALHDNGDVTYAVSRVSNVGVSHPNVKFNTQSSGVEWGTIDSTWPTGSVNSGARIHGHRLTSRIEVDVLQSPCCCVEQYADFTPSPDVTGGTGDPKQPSIVPAAIKPLTNIFIKLEEGALLPPDGTGDRNVVLATLDAGQSRHLDASYLEGCIHLLDIWYDNDIAPVPLAAGSEPTWYLGNRNILGLEDYSCYVTSGVSAASISDSKFSLTLGDARLVIWKKSATISTHATKFTNGFALNSGVPTWYDGSNLAEMTPLEQPEIIGVSGTPTHAGNVTHLSYNSLGTDDEQVVQVVIGYYDAQGVVHRSAPSFPVYIGQADASSWAAGEGWRLNIVVSNPLTILDGQRDYFIEAYSGLAGSVPQLSATLSWATGSPTKFPETINFPFILTPGSTPASTDVVRSAKAVYTAGDVLASDPWPAWSITARSARRMFAVSVSDPSTVYYSKKFEPGVSPEFSASLTVSLGMGRKITAIGVVDDKVLLFEKEAITILYGVGPDNTGANGDFTTESINTKLGCVDQDSVVTVPDGIAFYSSVSQEFHIVSRDMVLHDIGKPIMDFTDFAEFSVYDSVNFQAEHEVRWYLKDQGASEGEAEYGETPDTATSGITTYPPLTRHTRRLPVEPVAVFNYEYNKWTILDNQESLRRVAVFRNNVVGITSGRDCYGTVSPEPSSDVLAAYKLMSWETPWIRVNQLQDYGRFKGATFLGRSLNSWTDRQSLGIEASDLSVEVLYDYETPTGTYDSDTHLFRANQHFAYTNDNRLQFKIKPRRQKCQAIKFIITEQATTAIDGSEPTYTIGRGYELLAVDLHYGAKSGSSRLSAERNA